MALQDGLPGRVELNQLSANPGSLEQESVKAVAISHGEYGKVTPRHYTRIRDSQGGRESTKTQ